jgi:hypothetical protein
MNFVYNQAKFLLANGNLNLLTDNLALMLVTPAYKASNSAANLADANTINDGVAGNVASFEITTATVSGYTRNTLGSRVVVENDTDEFAYLGAANVTFIGLGTGNTVGGAVLVRDTGTNSTSHLIAFYDITDTPTNGGDITIQWATAGNGGVLKLA